MSEEILINVTPQETRVAVVENGVLQEVHIERARARGIVGNIYKGKVTRILPGMQAAFVDIGMDRAAFLHASDVLGRDPQPCCRRRTGRPAARYQRVAARRPGGGGAGGEGSAWHQGRARHHAHHPAGALPGVHAVQQAYRYFAEDRGRRRARATARHPQGGDRRQRTGWLHPAHGRGRGERRRTQHRHPLSQAPVEGGSGTHADGRGMHAAARGPGAGTAHHARSGARERREGAYRFARDLRQGA